MVRERVIRSLVVVGAAFGVCLVSVAQASTVGGVARWRAMADQAVAAGGSVQLTSISCSSSAFCMAVGSKARGSGLVAEIFNGSEWRLLTPRSHGPRSAFDSVSCRSAHWCVAVGSSVAHPSGYLPLAEFWNGRTWRVEKVPARFGIYGSGWALLESVSCPTEARCYAVGQIGPAQADEEEAYWPTWTKGKGWKFGEYDASQTIVTNLSGVSCSTTIDCFGVGEDNFKDDPPADTQDLYFAYHSGAWRSTTTAGTYAGMELNAVSCRDGYHCIAVGSTTSPQASSLLASVAFALSSGTQEPITAPPAAKAASLNGIACSSATKCVSVGEAQIGGVVEPLAQDWDGHRWRIQRTADPHAPKAILDSVSCPTPSDCIAVGYRQRTKQAPRAALIERTN